MSRFTINTPNKEKGICAAGKLRLLCAQYLLVMGWRSMISVWFDETSVSPSYIDHSSMLIKLILCWTKALKQHCFALKILFEITLSQESVSRQNLSHGTIKRKHSLISGFMCVWELLCSTTTFKFLKRLLPYIRMEEFVIVKFFLQSWDKLFITVFGCIIYKVPRFNLFKISSSFYRQAIVFLHFNTVK